MNLVQSLFESAERHPDRAALIGPENELSFAQLLGLTCGTSRQLQETGLSPGDRVLLLEPVTPGFYVRLLACFHAGLEVMILDPSADSQFLNQCMELTNPVAFIGSGRAHLLRLKLSSLRRVRLRFHTSGFVPFSRRIQEEPVAAFSPVARQANDGALITFTSGSTGVPKAAVRSHAFLLAQHKALARSLDHADAQVDLVTLPVFTLANLASGMTSVLADTDLRYPARADSLALSKQCRVHSVGRCAASPAFFQTMLEDGLLPEFQSIYTGGAPVFPRLLDALCAASSEMRVIAVYGSTEAEPIAHQDWRLVSEFDRKKMAAGGGLLAGRPVDEISLRIIRDQSGELIPEVDEVALEAMTLEADAVGEVIVAGEHVLKGYLNGEGDAENKIHCGGEVWHRTGDAACLDAEGRLWLQGRCSAAVRGNHGERLYPLGPECLAMEYLTIDRCALVESDGEPCLVVQAERGEIDHEELLKALAEFGVGRIMVVPEIPVDKRHNAKIDYPRLRQLLIDSSQGCPNSHFSSSASE